MKYTHEQLAEQMQEFGGGMTYRLAGKTIYCKGGGGGTSTTVQNIPTELKPLATAYANKAIDLSNQGFIPYNQQYLNNFRNNQGGLENTRIIARPAQIAESDPYEGLNIAQTIAKMTRDQILNGGIQKTQQPTNYSIYESGQGAYLSGPPPIDKRFADLNNAQLAGIGMTVDRALNGSPVADQANSTLMQTLRGGQTNPYLDSMVQRAQDSVKSNFNTAAVNSGSFGNSGLQEQFARSLGDTASQMYGQAYEGDKQRQMSALQLAPTYAQQDYQDASQLLNAGQILQNQDQQNKDFAYQQFQDWQNDPYKKLAAMSGVFGTNLGGSSTTTQSGGGGK